MPVRAEKAVIEPRKGRGEEALPPLALLVFTPQDIDCFKRSFPAREKHPARMFLAEVHTVAAPGIEFAMAGPMLGAPQAVLVLEKLVALGVRYVLALGWCGSLQPHLRIGDVVLPERAVSEEGTSTHYPLEDANPGPREGFLDLLGNGFEQAACACFQGTVWSTDAPYRETVSKVLAYREQKVLAVDMETSALFAVSAFRNIDLAVALVVSDELSTLQWRHGFRDEAFQETREKLPFVVQAVGPLVPSCLGGHLSPARIASRAGESDADRKG